MQVVINIDEENYENIKRQVNIKDYPDMEVGRAIANGVVLPKGYGRLIDAELRFKIDKVYKEIEDVLNQSMDEDPLEVSFRSGLRYARGILKENIEGEGAQEE